MDQSGLTAVLLSIGNLAIQEISLLCGVMDEVGLLKQELARLQGLLQDLLDKRRSDATTTILIGQIRGAIEDAENAIQVAEYMKRRDRLNKGLLGAVTRYACFSRGVITRHKVGVEIRHINRNILGIKEFMPGFGASVTAIPSVSGRNTSCTEDENDGMFLPQTVQDDINFVGFQEDYNQIVAKLRDPKESKLTAISVVAMGGAGKTTIARHIYTASEIKRHFDVAAWVSLPKEFKIIDLLKDIYKQITDSRHGFTEIDPIQGHKVREKIYQILLQKRYLLLLDGVEETDTWDNIINKGVVEDRLVRVFPDANNGSRVMVTTRNEDVARSIVEMPSYVHSLKPMHDKAAWKLLMNTALQSYRGSENINDFYEIGEELAKKCGGLPLALAILGRDLARNLNTQAWRNTLKDWKTVTIITGGQIVKDILARSYNDLPSDHLKSCFLYFAAFPGNYVIAVSDLIKLWIAEGLIPHTTTHSPEEEARKYVFQLAQRSLVQVVNSSKAHGWIEEIRIHDLLSEWCIEEARKDIFLDVIDKTTHRATNTQQDGPPPSRISLQSFHDDKSLQRRGKLRTLLGFKSLLMSLPKLRYLRVLHIEDSNLKDFSASIVRFIHLRYLCLRRCEELVLFSSIGQLLYLQTIDLRGTKTVDLRGTKLSLTVPYTLWDIPDLRHVYLEGEIPAPRNGQQIELQTLDLKMEHSYLPQKGKNMEQSYGNFIWKDALECWAKMTQLTTFKLRIRPIDVNVLEILAHMPLLVEIVLYRFNVLDKLPESQSFPQGLRKLQLFANLLKQDPMPVLEKLPHLVVLELWGYEGRHMSCSAKGFRELQELTLGQLSIDEWLIADEAMKKLSHLTLVSVEMPRPWKETKLPEGLLHLRSLKELKLVKMPQISEGDHTYEQLWEKVIIE